jgi:hypothetical protein
MKARRLCSKHPAYGGSAKLDTAFPQLFVYVGTKPFSVVQPKNNQDFHGTYYTDVRHLKGHSQEISRLKESTEMKPLDVFLVSWDSEK